MHQIIRRIIKTATTVTWTIEWETAGTHPFTRPPGTHSPEPFLLSADQLPFVMMDSDPELLKPDPDEQNLNNF